MLADFFTAVGGPLVFYYSIALIASLALVIQLVLMTVLDFGDADSPDDVDGTGVISVRSLTGFFGGFGWTGVIMLEEEFSMTAATLAGIVVGGVMMLSFAYLMRILYSLRESGNIDPANAIGETATVYVSIPPEETGTGQVQVMIQGRLQVVPAVTRSRERIPAERRVLIRELVGSGTYMVEPFVSSRPNNEKES